MKITKYPDGTSYVDVEPHEPNKIPRFIFRINSYEDLWHLNQLVDACEIPPIITIPNLLDAQADRRFATLQSSGLKLVLDFLDTMPVNQFKIFHPHNSEAVEILLKDVEIIDNSEFITKVLKELIITNSTVPSGSMHKNLEFRHDDNLILMSSDAGGFKPLMKLCDTIKWQGETTSASKFRNHGKPLVQVLDRDDYEGKDILIIDDICVYGGTFKGLAKKLKERNAGKLYLAVSHMTVQYLGDDPVTNYFDKVFTTNSKFDEYWFDPSKGASKGALLQPENLEIIKLF